MKFTVFCFDFPLGDSNSYVIRCPLNQGDERESNIVIINGYSVTVIFNGLFRSSQDNIKQKNRIRFRQCSM